MKNEEKPISQLEYAKVIGYLMYVMMCTRPNKAFVVGKLSGTQVIQVTCIGILSIEY